MTEETHRTPDTPPGSKPPSGDPFLQLMFFQPSDTGHVSPSRSQPRPPPEHYGPLRQLRAQAGAVYSLPRPATVAAVRVDSPAIEVMTDLRRAAAVTTHRLATIDRANQSMITHGVRALFVVDDDRSLAGIVTAVDILGEKPIHLTHARGLRHDEITVQDVMMPLAELEFIDLQSVLNACVGDIVATLRQSARQHALVVDGAVDSAGHAKATVCGIFSLTQIARQLGLPPQSGHEIARTFAEIEAAIGS